MDRTIISSCTSSFLAGIWRRNIGSALSIYKLASFRFSSNPMKCLSHWLTLVFLPLVKLVKLICLICLVSLVCLVSLIKLISWLIKLIWGKIPLPSHLVWSIILEILLIKLPPWLMLILTTWLIRALVLTISKLLLRTIWTILFPTWPPI
ncbi:MAG: hypothetical protein FD167_3115 [bacterium]|nr:MAG: hypothetical protein FD167_3115 [bacterium]